ncbi:MAG: hypothetical protein R3325_14495 [Thermoanaerobaculia bacterium]|nr:hypothetical protein [Thermoanaerobaculia bacterium]
MLVDRILAVVNDDPILASDVDRVMALELVEPRESETGEELTARVVEMLVEERLRFQEIDRFGFTDVPLEEVEEGFRAIRDRFPSSAAFAQRLESLGLDERELKNLVARQVMVLTFVEERLGPRVFVDLDEIQAYYEGVLAPELRASNQPVPPLEEVREGIRRVLREERLNEELARWTEELRRRADIEEYLDSRVEPPAVEPG